MATTVEDLVEITSALDADLVHIRVVDGNQDNKMTMENFIKLLPSIQTPVGDYIFSALSEDRTAEGLFIWAFDNAISQANYPALWNKLGHIFNEQHVSAGDADLSASGTLFYPTPIPGGYQRIGTPDTAIINSTDDVNDSTELITLATEDYDALHMTRGVLGTGADGVPVRLKLVSGTLPTGLSEDTTYFVKFKTTPDIELYTTEADAISSGTTNRVNLTDAVGTFKITQEGIALDDAGHDHIHKSQASSSAVFQNNGGEIYPSSPNSSGGFVNTTNPLVTGQNGAPRTTNETRPKTFISFGYIKAEHVTVAGEPVSALRYSTGWIANSDWDNAELLVEHNLGSDIVNLNFDLFLSVDGTDANSKRVGNENFSSSTAGKRYNFTSYNVNTDSFKIQTGDAGIMYYDEDGTETTLTNQAYYYKIVVIKPNLVATYADTSFRKVYDISDATDVTHTLPDASTQLTEQIIKRRGSGAGKVTMATVSSQTIEGLTASIWELEGEGIIVLFPSGGNWEIKEYKDYITNADGHITKHADGNATGGHKDSKNNGLTSAQTFNLPITFIASPIVTPTENESGSYAITLDGLPTTTTYDIKVFDMATGTAVTNTKIFSVQFDGKWRT